MTTALYTGLLTILFVLLSAYVIIGRNQFKIAISDGGNYEMNRRIRAQGNFAEYTPLFVILLAYAEHNGLLNGFVHLFGVVFVFGRLSHAYGLLKGEQYKNGLPINGLRYRIFGMACTFSCLCVLACILVIQYSLHEWHARVR